MSYIITNGSSYCQQTKNRAVSITEDYALATRFRDRLAAERLLARATKKLKGFSVSEVSDTQTEAPAKAAETKQRSRSKASKESSQQSDTKGTAENSQRSEEKPSDQSAVPENVEKASSVSAKETRSKSRRQRKRTENKADIQKSGTEKPEETKKPAAENKAESEKPAAENKAESGKPTVENKAVSGKPAAESRAESGKPVAEKKKEDVQNETTARISPQTPQAQEQQYMPVKKETQATVNPAPVQKEQLAPVNPAPVQKEQLAPAYPAPTKREQPAAIKQMPERREPQEDRVLTAEDISRRARAAAKAREERGETETSGKPNAKEETSRKEDPKKEDFKKDDFKREDGRSAEEKNRNTEYKSGQDNGQRSSEQRSAQDNSQRSSEQKPAQDNSQRSPEQKPAQDNSQRSSSNSGHQDQPHTKSGRFRASRREHFSEKPSSERASSESRPAPVQSSDIFGDASTPAKEKASGASGTSGRNRNSRNASRGHSKASESADKLTRRRYFTTQERNMVYNRTEGHCGICGRFIPLEEYTIDHIIPLSKGGTNDPDNLQPCCSFCNKAKDDSVGDEFFTRISRIFLYQAKLRYGKKEMKKLKKALKELED